MDTVIEVEGLRKEYRTVRGGRTVAVDGLDLAVPRGGVFGFLGPNGAGKTTTIRCLLGLVRRTGDGVRWVDTRCLGDRRRLARRPRHDDPDLGAMSQRVLFAKIAAALTGVFVLSLVIQALLGIALSVAAAGAESSTGADEAWLAESAGVALCVAALSTIFARFGFGLASAGRNTAVALGVGFGYLVIVENLVRGLRPPWPPWLPTDNAGLSVVDSPIDFPLLGRSTVGAGLYLSAVGAVLLLMAIALFRTRDVFATFY